MQAITDALAALTFDVALDDDEMLADVVVIARCTRMSDGRSTVTFTKSEGADTVTVLGLLEAGRQLNARDGWYEVDDEAES